MTTILAGILAFTAIIMLLVAVLLIARAKLVSTGEVHIVINGDEINALKVLTGESLLNTLASQGIFISSACGGRGTCGKCKVKVSSGGGAILTSERSHVTPAELRQGVRLACQLKVKRDLTLEMAADLFSARKWQCIVHSNRNVATFIKELKLDLPEGEALPFRAGGYVLVECPPHRLCYADFTIEPGYRERWDEFNLWRHNSLVSEYTHRSYSIANYPEEKTALILNVRIEPPPLDHPKAPPGIVSSYLFSLKPGDTLTIAGPFGEFFARESDNEMIYIGGGAGMAPMRSHIFDQLVRLCTTRKISFWYGARSLREAFYIEEFERLSSQHDNFDFTLALSTPLPEDNWNGPSGFIHQVLYDRYLAGHPAPEDAEYYLCGPPDMIEACNHMLEDLGVEPENILFDKFG